MDVLLNVNSVPESFLYVTPQAASRNHKPQIYLNVIEMKSVKQWFKGMISKGRVHHVTEPELIFPP